LGSLKKIPREKKIPRGKNFPGLLAPKPEVFKGHPQKRGYKKNPI